jgi:ubiquinone biosynthesis protein
MPELKNAAKNLIRLRDIGRIVGRYGFGEVLGRTRFFEQVGGGPERPDASQQDKTTAERFRAMLAELGPTFVKFGQVLSTRADVLPPSFVRELSKLQDRAPQLSIDTVREVVSTGLGRPVEELFAEIDPVPLASASMAQVHTARLPGGEQVVIKVQRPNIAESIRADLDLLYYLAQFLEKVVAETGIYTPTGIVDEFEKSLKAELDFTNEAENAIRFATLNEGRPFIKIPKVYREHSCATVLTLERLFGVKITQLDPAKHDRQQVARNLIDAVFAQLFVDGVFHADPHPGNIFVLDDGRIGLVDFGLVGRLTKPMQETMIVLCLAIALNEPDTVARLLYKVGVPDERVNLGQFRGDIAEILDRYLGRELSEIKSAALVDDMLSLAIRYKIKVPKEYALLTKATITLEGVVRQVTPDFDIVAVATPYAKQLLTERMSPDASSGAALRGMLQMQSLAGELPMQLSQILFDLEGGKFNVQVRSEELSKLVAVMKWLGLVIFAGFVAGAVIVGLFLLAAAQPGWTLFGVMALPFVAAIGLVLVGLLFGAVLGGTLLVGRVGKVSVKKLMGKQRR